MSACQQCARMTVELRRREGDLIRAAKKAAARPTPSNVAALVSYKTERQEARDALAAHESECEQVSA